MARPARVLRPMPAEAFNQSVIVRPAAYTQGSQGWPNPTGSDFAYAASVQPMPARAATVGDAVGGLSPQTRKQYDVLIAWADDPVIKALKVGDEIEWGGKQLMVVTPANSGGLNTLWRIECELVE